MSQHPLDHDRLAPRRFAVVTFGCKLNQFDSARAAAMLRAAGAEPASEADAALIVINTCTVTGNADHDARKAARRLRGLNPTARLIATGCYAERDAAALRASGLFDEVVGHSDRERLPAVLLGSEACQTVPLNLSFPDPARAFLKVQEGCDLACSYCVIPRVRGPGRSEQIADVVRALRALAAQGVREVGLTGVNVGMWGEDLSPRRQLADLLEALLAADLPLRLRLNSLEPRTVDDRVLRLLASAPERLAPHLQIPLQSGSDELLARMARNYRTRHYRAVLERAKELVPGICLGADVISGFPGEGEREHLATAAFLAEAPLDYLHVFRYSPRPGTRAADDPAFRRERPVGPVVRQRVHELLAIGRSAARRFRASRIGRIETGLVLAGRGPQGEARLLTGNYIEILTAAGPAASHSGMMASVRLTRLEPEGTTVRGEVMG